MTFLTCLRLAYQILEWGPDVARLLRAIGDAWHRGDDEEAVRIAETRKREQAAGRAARAASRTRGYSES